MEGQNQNKLLHRLSTGEKHSRRTESEYTITQLSAGEKHSGRTESEYTITHTTNGREA